MHAMYTLTADRSAHSVTITRCALAPSWGSIEQDVRMTQVLSLASMAASHIVGLSSFSYNHCFLSSVISLVIMSIHGQSQSLYGIREQGWKQSFKKN